MIVYQNQHWADAASGYNAAYRGSPEHFKQDAAFALLARLLDDVRELKPRNCIEIGCGQGELLAFVYQLSRKLSGGSLQPSGFLGVDISDAAIRQCDAKHPALAWVVDSFQGYLESEDLRARFPDGCDLILNKSGLTKVASEAEFESIVSGIKGALSRRGYYLWIISKPFYRKWISAHTSGWKRDPVQIMFDCFGEPHHVPDESRQILLFSNDPAREREPFPREVEFEFEDGGRRRVEVYFDYPLRERVKLSAGLPPGRCAPERSARSVLAIEMKFTAGPRATVGLSQAVDWNSYADLDVRRVARAFRWSKSLVERATEVCLERCDHVLMGGSFSDWLVDPDSGQTRTDPDEFEAYLDWFIEFVTRYQPGRLAFFAAFPWMEQRDPRTGEMHSAAAAARFRNIIAAVTQAHGVRFIDVSPRARGLGRLWGASRAARRWTLARNVRRGVSDFLRGAGR